MTVETCLRRIEKECRENIAVYKNYKPIIDGKEHAMKGARAEARGCVTAYEEIKTLCRKLRKGARNERRIRTL